MKYRFWEEKHKRMTYITIVCPNDYKLNNRIYLKDILSEKNGVKFCLIFMYRILQSQIEAEI